MSGEWYMLHKCLTKKQARNHLNAIVVHLDNKYELVELSGERIGDLDPNRLWVRKMIIAQEKESGSAVAQAHDRSGDPGESGEWPEGWTPAR